MSTYIKQLLEDTGMYNHIRYSLIFSIYQRIFKPGILANHRKEVNLYKSFLGNCNLIFDIGAYDGHKTAAFVEISQKVVSCEPDPHNFSLLSARFRNHKKRIELVNAAVFNKNGIAVLRRNYKGSAFNTLHPEWIDILEKDNLERWNEKIKFNNNESVEVKTTTLNALIEKYGRPDFIKIDVEGSEKEVFQGLDHPISAISFECLLPEFRHQLIFIIDKLISLDSRYEFNVIHDEELLFKNPVNYPAMMKWLDNTELFSFDALALINMSRAKSDDKAVIGT